MSTKITKVLIANRGEIARRIQRACRKLGLACASILSEADKDLLFGREADEPLVIGGAAPKDSYLAIDKILSAAVRSGCDAVHPGYGFLSENAEFARRVQEAGLIFIGPTPDCIAALGSKTAAKAIARRAGVPCAPSSEPQLDDGTLCEVAEKIGFPVLVKAVAGGGGRGMRLCHSVAELREGLPRARAEALKFFSNPEVYLEKYIDRPRHVEVQIFGDTHGNLIHLGTRDCSTQRRHQKLIEEAPAPFLPPKLREEIHAAALAAGKAVGYTNAGTVEFLVKSRDFYFLEVNTRIQVEHPVTEAITGLDLVELQIRVARGEPLPIKQEQVTFTGHAIEYRICAEDVFHNFSPARGKITEWNAELSEFVREDRGFGVGDEIALHYDSLLSKVVVNGHSRVDSIHKSQEFFSSYRLVGVKSTVALHRSLLYNLGFRRAPIDIGWLEREFGPEQRAQREVEFRALEVRDPRWKEPVEGASVKNLYEYRSEKFKMTYTIEILHKRDGFFVAVPVDSSGRRGKSPNCRMSNGLNAVMKSLINDVLEKTPPSEIFA